MVDWACAFFMHIPCSLLVPGRIDLTQIKVRYIQYLGTYDMEMVS